jgi:hypothetical protein
VLNPRSVSAAVALLANQGAPSRVIVTAGAGVFAVTHIAETPGLIGRESAGAP